MNCKEALVKLGEWIDASDSVLHLLIKESCRSNPWFTKVSVEEALLSIAREYLERSALTKWLARYPSPNASPKAVALVLAGNIPLVGFHDLLCVILSGHKAIVKLSDKDAILLPGLIRIMAKWFPKIEDQVSFVSRLQTFDAVIATGSNQSSRYFQKYFAKHPHIIRKNRNAVAILTGHETDEDLVKLGDDIFSYFGLGCRNVSKAYFQEGYDFGRFLSILNGFSHVMEHNKYKNNFDYHLAAALINRQKYMTNDCLILVEESAIPSRIGVLHYEYYNQLAVLEEQLHATSDQIQCIVSNQPLQKLPTIKLGNTQKPTLMDYADGIDTMRFLHTL